MTAGRGPGDHPGFAALTTRHRILAPCSRRATVSVPSGRPTWTRSSRSRAGIRWSTCSPSTGRGRPISSRAGWAGRCGAASTVETWSRRAMWARTWCRSRRRRTTRGPSGSGRWPAAAASRRSSAGTGAVECSGTRSRPSGTGPGSCDGGSPTSRSTTTPLVEGHPDVRRTTRADLELLYPACVAMYTEEVGVSPELGGGAELYRARVQQLISRAWSFARFERDRLVFKAEVACASPSAAQIQGVFVPPDLRGQGLAVSGMAAVVNLVRRDSWDTTSDGTIRRRRGGPIYARNRPRRA